MASDVAARGLSVQEQAELGALMAEAGLDNQEVRALVGVAEKIATQVALSMVPVFADLIKRTHVQACESVLRAVLTMPTKFGMGYVDRNELTKMIRLVATTPPHH